MIAQRHADQCKFAHDCSECRQVDRFSVGQNLFIMKQSVRPAPADWQRVVGKWYGEVASFGRDKVGFIGTLPFYTMAVFQTRFKSPPPLGGT